MNSRMWYTTIKPAHRGRSTDRIYYDEMYSSEGLASWDYEQERKITLLFELQTVCRLPLPYKVPAV
jgi:hypothetical protein